MTLLDILKLNNPLFERIDVSPIFDELKSVVGWHSIAYSPNSLALAGGTHQDQSVATRICVAEALERVLAGNLYKDVGLKLPKKSWISTSRTCSAFLRERCSLIVARAWWQLNPGGQGSGESIKFKDTRRITTSTSV